MKLWNWFLTLIGKRFPLPPRHILTYEEIQKYWDSLSPSWQKQCKVIVLRIRKPRMGALSMLQWKGIPTFDQILMEFTVEPNDPFTIRIDREWEKLPGIKVKEEVCIANFEL